MLNVISDSQLVGISSQLGMGHRCSTQVNVDLSQVGIIHHQFTKVNVKLSEVVISAFDARRMHTKNATLSNVGINKSNEIINSTDAL